MEAIIGLVLACALLIAMYELVSFATHSTARLAPKLAAQQATRKAVARVLSELQESMEVVSPRAGSTLAYAVVRDRLALLRWYFLVQQAGAPNLYELHVYRHDPKLAAGQREEVLMRNVRRLAFTARTEGALQVNLLAGEEGRDTSILTTVRLRNIASAEELW